jgi:hypothetical protein
MTPLFDRFVAHFALRDSGAATLVTTKADLRALQDQAASLCQRGPQPVLSQEQRERFATKRSPELPEILRLCADGLAKNPEIVDDTGVSPEVCRTILTLDDNNSRLIKSTGDLAASAEDASRACAAEATESARAAVLFAAELLRSDDPSVIPLDSLEMAFSEALRLYAASISRADQASARARAATADAKARIADAKTRAADATALDALITKDRR